MGGGCYGQKTVYTQSKQEMGEAEFKNASPNPANSLTTQTRSSRKKSDNVIKSLCPS